MAEGLLGSQTVHMSTFYDTVLGPSALEGQRFLRPSSEHATNLCNHCATALAVPTTFPHSRPLVEVTP